MASMERTAYPRFGRLVSARELDESFTPTPEEIGWARSESLLAAAWVMLSLRVEMASLRGLSTNS